MDIAETLVRMDDLGVADPIPALQAAVAHGTCPLLGTGATLVCNIANRADPRFSIVPATPAERSTP